MAGFDEGLLSPVTVGHDQIVSDAALLDALVAVEVALTRAWAAAGVAPQSAADDVSAALGWRGRGELCDGHGVDVKALALAAVEGGNPVIALVAMLRERVEADSRPWVHRGATSQDILDTALVLLAARALDEIDRQLGRTVAALGELALAHRHTVAAARTLTQHAVPTTWGARFGGWIRGISRARLRLQQVRGELQVQLGGAAGTLAAFVQIADRASASSLPGHLEQQLGLPGCVAEGADHPWHVQRWPITELADVLVQTLDALGKLAADVATASRTEVGELAQSATGTSSAMPQKQNPVVAVLIRSAAIRAPQLGATLHLASALAVDERPDGAWHAEWMPLRELFRLGLGAAAHAAALAAGLRVDEAATARNLALTHGLVISERLGLVLTPLIGRERFAALIASASAGQDLRALVAALPEAAQLDLDDLLDPAAYVGLADALADDGHQRATAPHLGEGEER